ncbi:LysR family transcriptional regulator [Oxalobacteraceae bacterium]|nr:LysR family transcriptional regulator [Oxalobacteraceae bacterium]
MAEPTVLQLQCFAGVVAHGSFSAAAAALHRTHPTVHAAVSALEAQLGIVLFDRGGYRVALTAQGRAYHASVLLLLKQFEQLRLEAAQLAAGEEPELRVAIGDLCPLPATLALLKRFFGSAVTTRLNLLVEAIAGPWERLHDGDCDLIFHHLDKPSPQLETIALFDVTLIPVAAPGFLGEAVSDALTPDMMRPYVQCVIRDSSRRPAQANYYLIDGARSCSVADQLTKRELILQGMGWGHLPAHLVREDLDSGRLLSLEGRHLRGATLRHYAIRRRDVVHGPVARRLWEQLRASAAGPHADQIGKIVAGGPPASA